MIPKVEISSSKKFYSILEQLDSQASDETIQELALWALRSAEKSNFNLATELVTKLGLYKSGEECLALVTWFVRFGPFKVKNSSQFKKDKRQQARRFDILRAMQHKWWKPLPEEGKRYFPVGRSLVTVQRKSKQPVLERKMPDEGPWSANVPIRFCVYRRIKSGWECIDNFGRTIRSGKVRYDNKYFILRSGKKPSCHHKNDYWIDFSNV